MFHCAARRSWGESSSIWGWISMMLKCSYFFLGKISPLPSFRIEIRNSRNCNCVFSGPAHVRWHIFFCTKSIGVVSVDPHITGSWLDPVLFSWNCWGGDTVWWKCDTSPHLCHLARKHTNGYDEIMDNEGFFSWPQTKNLSSRYSRSYSSK